jgi:hypothetical protein
MTTQDLTRYGASEGVAGYLVQQIGSGSQYLEFVTIDAVGNIKYTGLRQAFNPAARTVGEALALHFADEITSARADLERRREEMPEEEPTPPADSPATKAFFDDSEDDEW